MIPLIFITFVDVVHVVMVMALTDPLCAGCTGSTGNVGFALSTFHLGSTNNSAKNLVPQYSGGTFYLSTGSGSGVAHTVYFYYV